MKMKGRRKIPLGTFWIGAFAGAALTLPLVATCLHALARTGVGDPDSSQTHVTVLAFVFAGFPTFLAGGGVARLAAHRLAERDAEGRPATPGQAVRIAALAMAIAGAGAAILTAIPGGGMPESKRAWIPVVLIGLVCGAVAGVAIGVLTGMRQRRFLEDT